MASTMSLENIVSRLEAQIAFHREREAFHAGQEVIHREQRSLHAAELETLTSSLEAFKTSAAAAMQLASRAEATLPASEPEVSFDIGRKPSVRRMIDRIVESKPPDQAFGTSAITAEINRRFKDRLRRPVKEKVVSITLRRMRNAGVLRDVRKGRPHHEALYTRA